MAITSSSKVQEILDNPAAVEIVKKYFPGIEDPRIKQGSGMPLKVLMAFPQSKVTKADAKACAEALEAANIV